MKKKEKVFKANGWTHIILEGYCFINMEYFSNHSKWLYTFDPDHKLSKKDRRSPNPTYDPKAKPNKKPTFCKGHVCGACLNCKGFAYVVVDDKNDYNKIMKYERDRE